MDASPLTKIVARTSSHSTTLFGSADFVEDIKAEEVNGIISHAAIN